jgi:hypothetical protein
MPVVSEPNHTAPAGPSLIVTTRYLRRGPRRVALRTRSVALPGTYELTKVVGGGIGGLLVMLLSLPVVMITGAWEFLMVGLALGAVGGVFVTSWSPLRGESLARWFLLYSAKRSGLVHVRGRWGRVYVGVCALNRSAFGRVKMVSTCVEVPPQGGPAAPIVGIRPAKASAAASAATEPGLDERSEAPKRAPLRPAVPDEVLHAPGPTFMGRSVVVAPPPAPGRPTSPDALARR